MYLYVNRVWLEQGCKSDGVPPLQQLKRCPVGVLKTGDLIQRNITQVIFTALRKIIILGTSLGDRLMQSMLNFEEAPFP